MIKHRVPRKRRGRQNLNNVLGLPSRPQQTLQATKHIPLLRRSICACLKDHPNHTTRLRKNLERPRQLICQRVILIETVLDALD